MYYRPKGIFYRAVNLLEYLKKIANIPCKLNRIIRSSIAKKFNLRPSSKLYLSGDTYRALADAVYDNTHLCRSEDIKKGNLVYASAELLDGFCHNVLPSIHEPFVLITHQPDNTITNSDLTIKIVQNKYLTHWFAQNCFCENKKITPLPIGLEDLWRHNAGELADYKKKSFRTHVKLPRILMSFSIQTNSVKRQVCYDALINNQFVDHGIYSMRLYRRTLRKYMFVASPGGNGPDTHRTWEAMYMGVIPIVEDNYMNRYFVSLGLPMYIVKNWEEINSWDEDKMKQIYSAVHTKENTEPLWLEYWVNQFNQYSALKEFPDTIVHSIA
jgi:hypothetical protein